MRICLGTQRYALHFIISTLFGYLGHIGDKRLASLLFPKSALLVLIPYFKIAFIFRKLFACCSDPYILVQTFYKF